MLLSLSVLVSFSGCSNGGGDTTTTEDTSSADVETTTEETTSDAEEVTTTVEDVEVKLESHVDEIEDISATDLTYDMQVGWNLGNSLDAYSNKEGNETAWGNPEVNLDLIKAVADAGFKCVRIPVTYMGQCGDAPDYTINEDWLNRVQEVVDMVTGCGMYAIINIHHDGNNDTNGGAWLDITQPDQTEIQERFKKMWEQISTKFADYDEYLVFESMNEIHDGTYQEPTGDTAQTYYDNINALNQIFVDTVRASGGNNELRCLLVPGWNTNIDYTVNGFNDGATTFDLPEDTATDKLMVSVHYYDPYDYCLKEALYVTGWGLGADRSAKWGNEDYVNQQFQLLEDTFVSQGVPVIIGEFGAVKKVDEDSRRYYLEYVTKSAKEHGLLPVYWDNGWDGDYGFSLFDRTTGEQQHPDLIEAIVRAGKDQDYEIALPAGYDATALEALTDTNGSSDSSSDSDTNSEDTTEDTSEDGGETETDDVA